MVPYCTRDCCVDWQYGRACAGLIDENEKKNEEEN